MSGVAYLEGFWQDPSSSQRLSYRFWKPSTIRALLVILHGFNEHSGRYPPLAQVLAEQGIAVAVPDLQGHGRSEGRRGDMARLADCVTQLSVMTTDVFLPKSGLTRYALFGHSLGGLLAILWTMRAPSALRRVILTSPFLAAAFPVAAWKTAAVRLAARCWPSWPFALDLDVDALCHDPGVIEAYHTDPLVHNVITARTYWSIRHAQADALAGAAACRRPILMLCGGADRIASVPVARHWFDRLTCEKSSTVFLEAFHELHHEPVRDEVVCCIRDWTLTDA